MKWKWKILPQRLQRVERGVLERLVAVAAQLRIDVGDAFLEQLADARRAHLAVVLLDFQAALQLALHADFLADEQQRDAEHRLAEEARQRRGAVLAVQLQHGVVEQLQTFHLHLGARKAVDDHALVILRRQQFLEQQADHLAVADHLAGVLDGHGLRAGEQVADDDGRRREKQFSLGFDDARSR